MKRRIALFAVLISPLFMAMQCGEDDAAATLSLEDVKVTISPETSLTLGDTLWIEGEVTSKAYNSESKDSIFNNLGRSNSIAVYKFVSPNLETKINTKDALNSFQIVNELGATYKTEYCPNADFSVESALSEEGLTYRYRIGIKAIDKGDFIITVGFQAKLLNTDRNVELLSAYALKDPGMIGFNSCNNYTWTFIDEITNGYLFSVQ